MEFNEYDHVRIKNRNVTGIIIDIFEADDGKTYYNVEDDYMNGIDDPDKFDYPQYDCLAEELEKID